MRIKNQVVSALILFVFLSFTPEAKSIDPPEYVAQSQTVLKSADLNEIERFHCTEYQRNHSNTTAAFGCFMAKMARMFESGPAKGILIDLGEPPVHVQDDILSKTNPNSLCTKMASMPVKKYYRQFPNLPFSLSYDFSVNEFGRSNGHAFFREMLARLRNGNVALSHLQNNLVALDSQLGFLLELLSASMRSDFSFTVPKELCQVPKNVVVRAIDIKGFYGMLGALKFAADLASNYKVGLNLVRFVNFSGSVNKAEFVKDANGVGGDNTKFVELIPPAILAPRGINAGTDPRLEPLLLSTVQNTISFLDTVRTRSSSQVFGRLITDRDFATFLRKINNAAKDIKNSLEHPRSLVALNNLGHRNIKIDLSTALKKLPNPAAVKTADPFVLANHPPFTYQTIEAVPTFFRKLLEGAVRF